MERKFKIPKMSDEELLKWYSIIKPLFFFSYLRPLSLNELKSSKFNSIFDFTDTVDYSALAVLADVKMLHSKSYNGSFAPTVEEVITQIPKELLEKVVAFELMAGPVGKDDIYRDAASNGYHVSIVRLYEVKNDSNIEARPLYYPSPDSQLPLGMTEKEFAKFKEKTKEK